MPRTYLPKDRCKFSIGVLSIKLNKYLLWLDILQLQNTTSSNHIKLPKKYVKSTLKFYYENLINNKLSKLDQKK
jgi:hypothetical protein